MPLMDRLAGSSAASTCSPVRIPALEFLLTANRTMRDIVDTLVREGEFSVVVAHLDEKPGRSSVPSAWSCGPMQAARCCSSPSATASPDRSPSHLRRCARRFAGRRPSGAEASAAPGSSPLVVLGDRRGRHGASA